MTNRSMVYSNGDTENIEYKTYDEIGTVPVKMTQVTNHHGVPTTSVTSYMGGIRVSEVVTTDDSEFTYSCSDLDSQLVKSVENKGTPNERTSLYTYNDNNTISVSIKEGNKSITQVRAIPIGGNARDVIGDERTITYENIINENGESIKNIYLTEGHGNARIETITSLEGKVTRSIYNENGKKENSVVEYNDQQYAAEYDGKGNTYMVYTIDDPARMAKLARAFGTTPEAIFAFNKDLVHTNPENGAKYFVAGTKIRIPGEIPADNRYLQARGSQEYEVARGNQLWGDITEMINAEAESRSTSLVRIDKRGNFSNFRDFALYLFAQEGNSAPNNYLVEARVNELKDLNRGLVDGQLSGKSIRFKYNASKEAQVHSQNLEAQRRRNELRKQKEDKAGAALATKIYNIIENESYAIKRHGGEALFKNDVNETNIISFLEKYKQLNGGESLFTHINEEWDTTTNDLYNVAAMKYLIGELVDRLRVSGINDDNVMKFYNEAFSYIDNSDIDNLNTLVDKVCSQCRLLESRTQEETASSMQRNVSTSNSTMQGLTIHSNSAESTLEYFNNNEETFCGTVWEGLKYICRSDNLDENVKADIEKFNGYIQELDTALKTGGEEAFRLKFKQIFNRDYDEKIAREYAVKLENFENAVAIQGIKDAVDNFRSNYKFEELSYTNLTNCYKLILSKIDPGNKNPEATIEKIIMSKLGSNYSNATLEQKRSALIVALNDFMGTMNQNLKNYTGGKSLSELQEELSMHSSDLFGPKCDVMNRVSNYIASQKAGDVYVSTALKIMAMSAFGLSGGGFILSAVGTFTSSAGIDILNHPEALGSSSQMWQITKEAALDGLFSGVGTFVRDGLKAGKLIMAKKELDITKFVNITKGNASFAKTQGVLVSADSSISTAGQILRGNYSPKNIGITVLWSTIAHVGSVKIVGKTNLSGARKSNFERCFRRTFKGGGKEERAADKHFSSDLYIAGEVPPDQMRAQVQQYISSINNLGNLNSIKRFVNEIPQEYGRDDLMAMINNRTKDLLENRAMITIDETPISPEIRSNALKALAQPAQHLLPEQLDNIMDYIDTITDPNELWNITAQLEKHGMDFAKQSEMRNVLDDKFAEFNQMPPYKVGNEFILYAYNSTNSNVSTVHSDNSVNTFKFANYPTLNMFMENKNSPMTMLDTKSFNKLKDELYSTSQSLISVDDLKNIIAQVVNISDQNQRLELQGIVQSIARMNGLTLS